MNKRVLLGASLCLLMLAAGLPAAGGAEEYGAYQGVLERVKSKDRLESVRAAQEMLDALKPADIPFLLKLLKGEDRTFRQLAMEGLCRVGDATVVDTFAAALEDPDPTIRNRACEALGKLKDPRGTPALMRAIQSGDFLLRKCAFTSLEACATAKDARIILPLLEGDDLRLKGDLMDLLGRLKAVDALPALEPLLQDKEPYIRAKAAEAVAAIGGKEKIPLLTPLVSDSNEYVKYATMAALTRIGTPEALDLVRPYLQEIRAAVPKGNIGMQMLLVGLLGDLKDVSSTKEIIAAYKFDDGFGGRLTKDLRLASVKALGKVGDKKAVEALIEALKDTQTDVRVAAIAALGDLKDKDAVAPLEELRARESNIDTVRAIQAALAKIGPEPKAKAGKAKGKG